MSQPKLEPWRATFSDLVSPTESIIEEARNGRMFVLVDDEGRENEGDLVIPAQMATPDAINFMAKFGRGLICLAMTGERVEHLGLPLMAQHNGTRHQTAFTVSIEAREGVTTGISAPDRARTIATAIDPSKGRVDIVTPGHVFPLQARDGGVLVRAGHTEAAVDLARLAGLNPSGVICEIMNDDGTMARRDDLIAFAQRHGLKIGTIADLIAYRRRHDRIVERSIETEFESRYGGKFQMIVYVNRVAYAEHIALVKGDISAPGPVPVRMHALNVLDDVLGDCTGGRGGQLQTAMQMIADHGRGVVVMIREPQPTSLSERVLAHHNQKSESTGQLRDYGVGAQILIDLGVREMILISNTKRTIVGLEGYGLTVVDQWSIPAGPLRNYIMVRQSSAKGTGAPHVLIVESRFYAHISDELLKGATQALEAAGCSYERIEVPGAFEVPAAIRIVSEATHGVKQPFDGYIALGCVIRGETTHYDYVCGESARGIQELAIRHGLAIGYGILTVENEAQALARARISEKNKGKDAVNACLAVIALKRKYGVDRVIEADL